MCGYQNCICTKLYLYKTGKCKCKKICLEMKKTVFKNKNLNFLIFPNLDMSFKSAVTTNWPFEAVWHLIVFLCFAILYQCGVVDWFSDDTFFPNESVTIWKKIDILMLDGDRLLCVDLCHVFMLTILLDLSVISIKFQFQKFIESIAE